MATSQEALSFKVLIDIRDSLKAMEKFNREMNSTMKGVSKSSEAMGKTAAKASNKATDAAEEQKEAVQEVSEAYEDQGTAITNLQKTVAELKKLSAKASGDEKKAIEAQIASLEKLDKKRSKQKKESKGVKRFVGDVRKVGKALKEPLRDFLQRDLKGLVASSFKAGGLTLEKTLKHSKVLTRFGMTKASRAGRALQASGRLQGGASGLAMQAGGVGLKGIATAMSGLGKGLSSLSKLGAMLSPITGILTSLVTLFIDADAAAKEFNKGILQSASTTGFLAQSGNDATKAGQQLKNTMQELRDAANNVSENWAMGLNKEDFQAVHNVLTQEGVDLARLNAEAVATGKSYGALATQLTKTGVAYSVALGVPISEVGQLQAEMMTEMGRNVEEVRNSFSMLHRSAEESGIAGNKFFATIRSVSSDLGLYNLRLQDSVALLGKLGKVMSPKSAQQFLQNITSATKNMGLEEKLKVELFSGGSKTIQDRDIAEKMKELFDKLAAESGENADALRDAFKKDGMRGIAGALGKVKAGEQGALTESLYKLFTQTKMVEKGQFGRSTALSELGIGGTIEILTKAVTAFSKGKYKSIGEARGSMELETVAREMGFTGEQLHQLGLAQVTMETQRAKLLKEAKTPEEQAKVKAMGDQDLIRTMADDLQKSVNAAMDGKTHEEKVFALAEETRTLTVSLEDRLKVLTDWFMNEYFGLIMKIKDILTKWWGGDEAELPTGLQLATGGSKNSFVQEAKQKAGDDPYAFRGELFKTGFSKQLKDALAKGGPNNSAEGQVDVALGRSFKDREALVREASIAASAAGVGPDTLKKFTAEMHKTGDMRASLDKVGVSGDTRASVFHQAAGRVDPRWLPGIADSLGTPSGGSPAAATTTTPPVTKAVEATQAVQTEALDVSKQQLSLAEDQKAALDKNYRLVKSQLAKEIEEGVLASLRTALYEYYMYSGIEDRSKVARAFAKGGGVKSMAPALVKSVEGGKTLEQSLTSPANASGGMVTGVSRGLASVRAAAGEGLASVGVGERIVPAGGGGSSVTVNVNGVGGRDLANLIEGKVVEGVREFKRREKFY